MKSWGARGRIRKGRTDRTSGVAAMKAMPALMNGTFSPYCSVTRVFNIEFFLVQGYRVSGPSGPMNFCPVVFRGKYSTANFADRKRSAGWSNVGWTAPANWIARGDR